MQATPTTFDQCQISLFLADSASVGSFRRADLESDVHMLIAKKSVKHGMQKSLARDTAGSVSSIEVAQLFLIVSYLSRIPREGSLEIDIWLTTNTSVQYPVLLFFLHVLYRKSVQYQ